MIATFTIILAFLPIALAEGSVGEYTLSVGQVVILVLLGSWFMSMYMTPAVSYWFVKGKPKESPGGNGKAGLYDSAFYRGYRRLLETLLRWRLVCIAVVIAIAVGVAAMAGRVAQEFFPPNDRNQYLLYLDLEAGAHIDETTRVVETVTDWLGDASINPEVSHTVAYVGSGGPRFFLSLAPINPDPHVAFVLVETRSNLDVPEMVRRTRAFIDTNIPEVHGKRKAMWFGPSETGVVEFRISGPDEQVLMASADHLLSALRAVPGTIEIEQDWENRVLEVEVIVDQARARRAGITSADISNTLSAFLSDTVVTDYREGDAVIPIVLRGVEGERDEIATLLALDVYSSARNASVPLSQIADVRAVWKPYTINRRNLERTVTVSATHLRLTAGQLVDEVRPALDTLDLPPGYTWEMGGELENAEIARGHLFANFPLAGFLIVLLLVLQFNSLRRAGIIINKASS